MKDLFLLDPTVTYLNHGSFGACPKPVFEAFQKMQLELETQPVSFILQKTPVYLAQAKEALAQYIGCDKNDFFFTPNPTVAINTVMRSLKLQLEEEILATDHEYGAMDMTWHFYCKETGAKYIRQHISLPVQSKEQILEEFWKGYSEKTKVVFINQMSSATALIFPVKEIVEKARELGLITIVDGAHVPGHFDLNIMDLNPDYYTGTLHKWMLAPKGSTFLYVNKKYQDALEPLVVSWGYETKAPTKSQFLENHEHQGTRDVAAFLCTPAVIDFLEKHNWKQQSDKCKQIVLDNYQRFCDLLETKPLCPVNNDFLGQMASIEVNTDEPLALKAKLINDYNIEIPVTTLNGKYYIRYSINAYNSQADLDKLYDAIVDIKNNTKLIK
jgi:isopenicillin-N epimerase